MSTESVKPEQESNAFFSNFNYALDWIKNVGSTLIDAISVPFVAFATVLTDLAAVVSNFFSRVLGLGNEQPEGTPDTAPEVLSAAAPATGAAASMAALGGSVVVEKSTAVEAPVAPEAVEAPVAPEAVEAPVAPEAAEAAEAPKAAANSDDEDTQSPSL